jgi:acetolactate synthase-1/2/3 large subunit
VDRLKGADLVIMLGDLPGEVNARGWLVAQQAGDGRLITIHPHPRGPGMNIAADPRGVLQALADQTGSGNGLDPQWLSGWRRLESDLSTHQPRRLSDGVDFGTVAAALGDLLDPDAIVTLDAGNFSSWIHRYLRLGSGQRLLALAGGAMGFGVPAAVAAIRRHPDRQILAVVGDGGLLMTGQELAGMITADRRPVIIVADNAGYATIQGHAARSFPGTDCGTDLSNPDLVAWAGSFGLVAERVDTDEQVVPALRRALSNPAGALLQIRSSRSAVHANFDLPQLISS